MTKHQLHHSLVTALRIWRRVRGVVVGLAFWWALLSVLLSGCTALSYDQPSGKTPFSRVETSSATCATLQERIEALEVARAALQAEVDSMRRRCTCPKED
jgi:hypothetical protein